MKSTAKAPHRRVYFITILIICVVNLSLSAVVATSAVFSVDDIDDDIDEDDDIKINDIDVDSDNQASVIEEGGDDGTDSSPPPIDSNDPESNIQEVINIEKADEQLQYKPPAYFQITAHVQTNLHTGYSYFLPKESLSTSFAHLPFLECGAVGSTTERLPLVSGVFRHVPHSAVVPKRDEDIEVILEQVKVEDGEEAADNNNDLEGLDMLSDDDKDNSKSNETGASSNEQFDDDDHPKRPTPPKYVVALSSMEITVGGKNGNETQQFNAGDVIFVEDTWWGVWDNDDDDDDAEELIDDKTETKMKGYIIRASSEAETEDLNVLMLTVPNAIHRHWKNAQHLMARRERKEANKQQQSFTTLNENLQESRRPWWKMPTPFLNKHNSRQQHQNLPKPCSLESDPTFAHPSVMSSTTLKQHFTQHFTNILRRSTNPHPSFLPHHHQDLLLPILAQTVAGLIGGATALAFVLKLWKVIPGPTAIGFGSACLVGLGTWGFVWLGEEILDQWELWREKRRLEWMMSEGWGQGGRE